MPTSSINPQVEARVDQIQAGGMVDMHYDLLMDLYEKRQRRRVLATDHLPQLRAGGMGVLGAAIYLEDKYLPEMALRVALDQVARLYAEVAETPEFAIGAGPLCDLLVTGTGADGTGADAVIGLQYLAWARETAPEMRGWEMYQDTDQGTGTIRQQVAITASALFSQALALNPPASTAVYVWIAPGRFEMGSAAGECVAPGFGECPQNEQPRHRVALDGYWIQRTAVTNEQYGRCVQAGVCKPPANSYWQVPSSARLPVTDVSWAKASQYAALVGGRLPTEAEWEYGCRGPDGRMYPWGDEPAEAPRLNYYNEYGRTIDVGSYAPGANGLYDMAGNVWEWTADWYDAAYYEESPERNPTGPVAETGLRPLRGGSWRNDGNLVRCAYRDDDDPANKYYNVGLRVVAPGF